MEKDVHVLDIILVVKNEGTFPGSLIFRGDETLTSLPLRPLRRLDYDGNNHCNKNGNID